MSDNTRTFYGPMDGDTELAAAAREAGWALEGVINEIAWEKREHVAGIITRLGAALSAADSAVSTKQGEGS